MSKSITQDMQYRQSLMKYAEKYGVSQASRKYNKSRSYIYFWRARWNGTPESLACRVPSAPQPSQSAHRGGDEADSGHAPPQSQPGHGGAVGTGCGSGLHPPPGEPVPGNEKLGLFPPKRRNRPTSQSPTSK